MMQRAVEDARPYDIPPSALWADTPFRHGGLERFLRNTKQKNRYPDG